MPQSSFLRNQWPTLSDYEWYTPDGYGWPTSGDYGRPTWGGDGWYTSGDPAWPNPGDYRIARSVTEALRDCTNPRRLRQEIYDQIEYIFSLPNAIPGQTGNVYLTLTTPLDLGTLPLNTEMGRILTKIGVSRVPKGRSCCPNLQICTICKTTDFLPPENILKPSRNPHSVRRGGACSPRVPPLHRARPPRAPRPPAAARSPLPPRCPALPLLSGRRPAPSPGFAASRRRFRDATGLFFRPVFFVFFSPFASRGFLVAFASFARAGRDQSVFRRWLL
jgi:hypothetical protein